MIAENLNEVHWHILFSQSFEELTKCSQNMSCGQCEVSKNLVYRHILKSIVKKLEEKNQKFSFSKLDLSLSVHMQSAVLLPPGCINKGPLCSIINLNFCYVIVVYFSSNFKIWLVIAIDNIFTTNCNWSQSSKTKPKITTITQNTLDTAKVLFL